LINKSPVYFFFQKKWQFSWGLPKSAHFDERRPRERASQRWISCMSLNVCAMRGSFSSKQPVKGWRTKVSHIQGEVFSHTTTMTCASPLQSMHAVCHLSYKNPAVHTPSWHSCGRSINYIGLRKCASILTYAAKGETQAAINVWDGFRLSEHRAQLGSLQHL